MTAPALFDPGPRLPDHPATFTPEILRLCGEYLPTGRYPLVLDPFAGTGGIHALPNQTVGVELEPEWARQHPGTIIGNVLALPFADDTFAAACTSPAYGNRLADRHTARDGSVRRSYTHDLGRTLHPDNSGGMQWGDTYRDFHRRAWAEVLRVLMPNGRLVLNCKDHIRDGQTQPVTAWHVDVLCDLGLTVEERRTVSVRGMGFGANRDVRVSYEWVCVFSWPTGDDTKERE